MVVKNLESQCCDYYINKFKLNKKYNIEEGELNEY